MQQGGGGTRLRTVFIRYRPFVIAVIAAALLVWWAPSEDDVADSGAASPTVAAGGAPTPLGDGATVSAADVTGRAPALSATGTGAAGGGGAAAAAAAPRAGAAPPDSGVGTPAALQSPKCDPNTGRIKLPVQMAPRCVRAWPGGADNGGATWTGVTADSIKVIVYDSAGETSTSEQFVETIRQAAAPYEHTHEMWGRKVVFEHFEPTGADEVAQRADAIEIATRAPFAVINRFAGEVFKSELAGRRIMVLSGSGVDSVRDSLVQAPFRWSIFPAQEMYLSTLAEFVAKSLAGRPARWAGDPLLQTQTRAFGLVYPDTFDGPFFIKELRRFGATSAITSFSYRYGGSALGDPITSQEDSRVIAAKLKESGVNNVIALTDLLMTGALTKEATVQRFRPEWTITSLTGQDFAPFGNTFDQDQWSHAFGVGLVPPPTNFQPFYHLHRWYWGADAEVDAQRAVRMPWLYIGIHLAGPRLTPQTFRDGWFAQPPVGGSSCRCPVSFQFSYGRQADTIWDDYSGMDDWYQIWWDPTAVEQAIPDAPPITGNYWFVNSGQKHSSNRFPTGEPPMFDRRQAKTRVDDPPQERTADYPCEGCPSQRR